LSLYRRGRIWWAEITSGGRRIRRSAGTSDKKAAQEWHDRLKAGLWRAERLGEPPPTSWAEAVAKWLAVKPRGLPDRYRLRALGIAPTSPLPLSSATVEGSLSSGTGSSGSWNRTLALVVAIHNAAGIKPPDVRRRPMPAGRTRWLSAEEWKRLERALKETSPLLAQAAAFTLATGLRENNVLELTWDQIDARRRVAWLHGDQVKTGVAIGVPLNDAASAILAARRGIHKRFVFGNPDRPLTKASNRAWYAALRKARLAGFRWHDLRHTWASWAVMSGVRLEELQRLGGWKTAAMVTRYAHLSPEHLAKAAAKIQPISLRRRL
jgi:integrase